MDILVISTVLTRNVHMDIEKMLVLMKEWNTQEAVCTLLKMRPMFYGRRRYIIQVPLHSKLFCLL